MNLEISRESIGKNMINKQKALQQFILQKIARDIEQVKKDSKDLEQIKNLNELSCRKLSINLALERIQRNIDSLNEPSK